MPMVIIKTPAAGGGQTLPLHQEQAKKYLANILGSNAGTRLTNLSQALNQAFGGSGKACGALQFNGNAPLHASAGVVGVSSVTVFYYETAGTLYCFAMGEHVSSSSYKISDFGPNNGSFKSGTTVIL